VSELASYDFSAQSDANPLPDPPWDTVTGFGALKIVSGRCLVTTASSDCWGLHGSGGVTWPADQWAAVIAPTLGGID
jgi:hypothetical protein